MRIINLTASNLMRLKAIDITPKGDTVIISGRNAQGKTSVLNAIWFALGGGPAQRGTKRPIRDGEETAKVTLDLGDLIVKRTWTAPDKTTLTVQAIDGAKYSSPQQMLDRLVGRLSFDPLAFSMEDEKQQLADLLALVELPFDPEKLAGQRQQLFDARQEIGREVRSLQGQLDGLPKPAAGQVERISIVDTLQEMNDAEASNRQIAVAQANLDGCNQQILEAQEERARIDALLLELAEDAAAANDRLVDLGEPVDIDPIRARLAAAEDANRAADQAENYHATASRLVGATGYYEQHTEKIQQLDAEKKAALSAAKMPVEGLSFDDDGVLFNGVPFRQCSGAERLRVSLGMAMAMNPDIRVIRITDGSLLDRENLALIEEMATANDFQIFVERVEDDDAQFIIEDGTVVESAAS